MRRVLGPDFFNRSTLIVARELLGKYLLRRVEGREVALMIIETEAYHGWADKASHARRGQTLRNTPMFMGPGTIYVYFTYGMHWMLNLVCGKKEFPAAVLVRSAGSVAGPARLTKFLSIDKSLNALPLGKKAGLWVEDRGTVVRLRDIARTPRIGINYAEEYVDKPWRFVLKESFRSDILESQDS